MISYMYVNNNNHSNKKPNEGGREITCTRERGSKGGGKEREKKRERKKEGERRKKERGKAIGRQGKGAIDK